MHQRRVKGRRISELSIRVLATLISPLALHGTWNELPEMRLWRLDWIVSIDLLDRGFARREDFDLTAYAAAVFQGIPGGADRCCAAVQAGSGG